MVSAATHADDVVHLAETAEHLDNAAELLSHADEVVAAAREAVEAGVHDSRPIIIDENMERVQRYADEIGGQTIADFVEKWSMEENERWIRQRRAEDREIIDIGPDFARRRRRIAQDIRPDASAYNLERRILRGYERYFKAFQRNGKYWGGVPGFDWLIRSAQ